MLLNLAIFLFGAAGVIAVIKPKSMTHVWIVSILTPFLFTFVFIAFRILLLNSDFLTNYQLGGYFGRCIPSILITIFTLFFCLRKKLELNDKFQFPKSLIVAIVICAIWGGFQLFISYRSQKVGEQLTEMIYNGNLKPGGVSDEINPITEKIREEMSEIVQDYNKDLSEDMGLGMTMKKCELQGTSLVYTIQWDGMDTSDFTDDTMKELREAFVEGIKEEQNSPIMKVFTQKMKDYGYDIIYRFINEKDEQLSSINISPFEI